MVTHQVLGHNIIGAMPPGQCHCRSSIAVWGTAGCVEDDAGVSSSTLRNTTVSSKVACHCNGMIIITINDHNVVQMHTHTFK